MREVVSIHVGQCGNQIGSAFWNLLLLEHEQTPDFDPALSSFFHFEPANGSTSSTQRRQGKASSGDHVMKARALLIDMECGPLTETMKGPLGSLFNEAQYIMDVSDGISKNLEQCDSLQAFFLTHSLGGGTGSGVGTYVIHLLHDEYPKVTRFSTCVYPSEENDVITSPYNTIFATRELINCADCVFPLNNSSLFNFNQLETPPKTENDQGNKDQGGVKVAGQKSKRSRGFDGINNIAARMLCHLTASSRFHGEMNVDLNEVYTNLVPFPRLHFLMTALNVRYPSSNPMMQRLRQDSSRSALQRAFADVTSTKGQLSGLYSVINSAGNDTGVITPATAFLARGKVRLSEFIGCVTAAQRNIRFPAWNPDACKIGMCSTASPGEEMSVMGVYNSSAFASTLHREMSSFQKLFRVKAMLHHYTQFVEEDAVREAEYEVLELIADYEAMEKNEFPRPGSVIAEDNPFFNNTPNLFPAF